jgi:hypothetical protein
MYSTRPKGYFICFDPAPPGGQPATKECDTMRCEHCDHQVFIPKEGLHDVGDLCRQCFEFICKECVKKGGCTPLEKRLAEEEARETARRSYGF